MSQPTPAEIAAAFERALARHGLARESEGDDGEGEGRVLSVQTAGAPGRRHYGPDAGHKAAVSSRLRD